MPAMSVRETPNTWRIAVRPKPRGQRRWGMLQLGKGIMVARFRDGKTWRSQSIIFPKARYSREEAVAWARAHRGKHGIADSRRKSNPSRSGTDWEWGW